MSILAAIVESGSFVRAAEALVGDETARPAIGRRLKELWPEARATVIVDAADAAEERPLRSTPGLDGIWMHRNGAAPGNPLPLKGALASLTLPSGRGYAWIAAEATTARALRGDLLERHGMQKDFVKAAAYWRHGRARFMRHSRTDALVRVRRPRRGARHTSSANAFRADRRSFSQTRTERGDA